PGDQVRVEHADDNADRGIQIADHEGGGNTGEVVAGQDQDRACFRHASLLQDLLPAAIADHQLDPAQPGILRGTAVVDDLDWRPHGSQVFQDPPADPAQTAQDEVRLHEWIPEAPLSLYK